jgi:cytochrome c-type biogenesis protein CcmF
MVNLGYNCLLISFVVSAYAAVVSLIGQITAERRFLASGKNAVLSVFILNTLASAGLVYAFLTNNFQIEYVASYSSRHLPLFYKISAFWAGQAGSLLFWEWLLSFFSAIVVLTNKRVRNDYLKDEFIPYVYSILMFLSMFFLSVLVFTSNPFTKLSFLPPDGRGLNPLLRNIGMVFHPPTLFLGYVGCAIPFAFFLAILFTGEELDDSQKVSWFNQVRLWTLFSWFFLGIGNLLGAIWAYVELGWGGYWAWDPVENASFMPWLLSTAFLHSLMMQEKKEMFKVWNYVLIVLTFIFTIFGTFIVRSGVLQSVHAFAKSPLLGAFFLGFIILTLVFSLLLALLRKNLFRSGGQIESFVSREASFLLTNLIFIATTFAILWGTIFPLITQAFSKQQVTVGAGFFNQVNLPIFLVLLLVTGLCPLLAWGKTSLKGILNNFLLPFVLALLGGGLLFLLRVRSLYSLISFFLSIFALVSIIQEFLRAVLRGNFLSLFWTNRRRYGALIIHLGVVSLFIGIAGSAFNSVKEVTLRKGESVEVKNYTFKYEDFARNDSPLAHINRTVLGVYKNGKKISTLTPEKNYDRSYEQWFAEVAVHTNFKEDIYAILGGADPDGAMAGFKIQVNPLVLWVWLGGIIITLGTVIVFAWSLTSLVISTVFGVIISIGIIIIIGAIL